MDSLTLTLFLSHIFLVYDDPLTPVNTCLPLWCPHLGRDVWGETGLHALVGLIRWLGHSPPHPTQCMSEHGMCVHCLLPTLHVLSVYVCKVLIFSLSLTQ